MLNSATTWLVWGGAHAVSLVVLTHSVELFSSLFMLGTVDNSSNSNFHNIKLMSFISFTLEIRHSPVLALLPPPRFICMCHRTRPHRCLEFLHLRLQLLPHRSRQPHQFTHT